MIHEFIINVCDECLNLKGELMCCNPECFFCRRTMKEVKEILDVLFIRMEIDGEVVFAGQEFVTNCNK